MADINIENLSRAHIPIRPDLFHEYKASSMRKENSYGFYKIIRLK